MSATGQAADRESLELTGTGRRMRSPGRNRPRADRGARRPVLADQPAAALPRRDASALSSARSTRPAYTSPTRIRHGPSPIAEAAVGRSATDVDIVRCPARLAL